MTDPALLAMLERIAVALENLAPPLASNDVDGDPWLAAALPKLQAMGPTFTAARAIELARTDAALAAILGEYDRPHGAMSLGRRLAEATDVVIDGRALVRRGADRGVAVYGVRACGHQVREVLIDKMRTS